MTMPLEPMLAASTAVFPTGKALRGAWFGPKWDGYRAMVSTTTAQGEGVDAQVWSRRGHDITRAFPDIAETAARLLAAGCVLDGGLLVWGDGRLDFAALQRRLAAGKNAAGLARTSRRTSWHSISSLVLTPTCATSPSPPAAPRSRRSSLTPVHSCR
jgi:ATP-dependent DNA ligase